MLMRAVLAEHVNGRSLQALGGKTNSSKGSAQLEEMGDDLVERVGGQVSVERESRRFERGMRKIGRDWCWKWWLGGGEL